MPPVEIEVSSAKSSNKENGNGLTLAELEPALFGHEGVFNPSSVFIPPSHLTPQLALHWIAHGSIASVNPKFAKELACQCIRFGADTSFQHSVGYLKKHKIYICESEIKITHLSPLASAITNKNTQSIKLLLGLSANIHELSDGASKDGQHNGEKRSFDADAPVGRVAVNNKQLPLNLWELCALFQHGALFPILDDALFEDVRKMTSIDQCRSDILHVQRREKAMNLMLSLPDISKRFVSRPSIQMSLEYFLKGGARPSVKAMQKMHIDQFLVMNLLCSFKWPEMTDIVKDLIDAGCPVNPEVPSKTTPIHTAVSLDWREMVVVLLDGGANPELLNSEGLNLEKAIEHSKNDDMINLYKSWTLKNHAMKALKTLDSASFSQPSSAVNF